MRAKKKRNPFWLFLLVGFFASGLCIFFFMQYTKRFVASTTITDSFKNATSSFVTSPTPPLIAIPSQKVLTNDYHIFQSFNNCGPAALSMALSYYGITKSQETLGLALRPYQNPQGNNDDKSVTLEELAKKAQEYNLLAYHRPHGSIEILQHFIAQDMPVITRTLLKPNEDIGHYRIVKGYDSVAQTIVQDDSLQGKNLIYSFDEFNQLWKQFNYEYLVLVPKENQAIAEQILGEDVDPKVAWSKAVALSNKTLEKNPDDTTVRFNLSIAYANSGDYQKSVEEFEKVENRLPFRTLWYQIEPIQAYYELGNYERVFEITDKILNNHNRAFSELYIIRGNIYKKQGNIAQARSEFEKAVFYNENLNEAKEALNSI